MFGLVFEQKSGNYIVVMLLQISCLSCFNLSFLFGVFPSILKSSKVIPIFKEESKLKCWNYPPISLLSNIDKILETIMYNRLYKFLECKNCFWQFLIHLTDKMQEQVDKENFDCGIFVYFQKAFDTVDHNILIHKLNYCFVRGKANNWFSP